MSTRLKRRNRSSSAARVSHAAGIEHQRIFRIGGYRVALRSVEPEVITDLAVMYEALSPEEAVEPTTDVSDDKASNEPTIHIEIDRVGRRFMRKRRYEIRIDGEVLASVKGRDQLLPYVEWGVNLGVVRSATPHLKIHAASLARDGQGVVFAAPSGSGKSTLAAALLSRGWTYYCDEFALIDPSTCLLHAFPKAVCVKAGAFDVVAGLGVPMFSDRYYVKALKGRVGYADPKGIGSGEGPSTSSVARRPDMPEPAAVRFVIFPMYRGEVEPRLYPVSRAQAVMSLAKQALNRITFGTHAMSVLGNVVRDAQCFGLESGRIDETCNLIESLVDGCSRELPTRSA